MSILNRNAGRQYPLYATVAFDYEDVPDATAVKVIDLPGDAVVVGGAVQVITAWDSTTNVVDVGDGDDPNRYTATPVDLKTPGRTALDITGFKYAVPDTIDLVQAETGTAPTQGEARLELQYILAGGRAHEAQPRGSN